MNNDIKNSDINAIINLFLQELDDIKAIEKQILEIEEEKLDLLKEFKKNYFY